MNVNLNPKTKLKITEAWLRDHGFLRQPELVDNVKTYSGPQGRPPPRWYPEKSPNSNVSPQKKLVLAPFSKATPPPVKKPGYDSGTSDDHSFF